MSGKEVIQSMVTERMVKALEAGTVPWRQPWGIAGGGLPKNIKSNKPYRGSNVFVLGMAGYASPWWGTWKQWEALGATVKEDQKLESSVVTFWLRKPRVIDDPDRPGKKKVMSFILRYTRAWNADQVDNVPEKFLATSEKPVTGPEAHAAAQKILDTYYASDSAPRYVHNDPNRAFYQGGSDIVNTPPIEAYKDQAEFYSTEFHEATHSTGHKSRCNRKGITEWDHFGSEKYSKEELVAEMGASILREICGVETDQAFDNSAAYIASWLRSLKNDHSLVLSAGAQAQHAVDKILGISYGTEEA